MTNPFDHDLPFQFQDTNGFLVTWWDERTQEIDGHDGYDWLMPEGTPLLAVADGVVTFAAVVPPFDCPLLKRTVNDLQRIEIWHDAPSGERFLSHYDHLSRMDVQVGQRVMAGQQLGLSGNTGCTTGPHVHFMAYRYSKTRTGQTTRIDPYGWEGDRPDPWSQHPQGAQSLWLWKEGQAPVIFREATLSPNPNPGDNAEVAITNLRWMGWKDDEHPNNEFVQLELDPRFAPAEVFDLTGFRLQNNHGDAFQFPQGFRIQQNKPVRIFTGSGTSTKTDLYWGLLKGIWDNMGDCARLVKANGRHMYHLYYLDAPCK